MTDRDLLTQLHNELVEMSRGNSKLSSLDAERYAQLKLYLAHMADQISTHLEPKHAFDGEE